MGVEKSGISGGFASYITEKETTFSKISSGLFGFMMLFPFNMNLALGSVVVKRFGCDPGLTSKFVAHFLAIMVFVGFIAVALMCVASSIIKSVFNTKKKQLMVNAALSIVIMFFTFSTALASAIAYITSEGSEYLTTYFVMSCLCFFCYCSNAFLVPKVCQKHTNMWAGFIPLGSICVSIFGMLLVTILDDSAEKAKWIPGNVHMIHVMLCFATFVIWASFHYFVTIKKTCDGADVKDDVEVTHSAMETQSTHGFKHVLIAAKNAISPFSITVISHFFPYIVFPALFPLVFENEKRVMIMLTILLVDGIVGLVYNALCGNVTKLPMTNIAASWHKEGKTWHLLWILVVPYLVITMVVMNAIQNRDGDLFKAYTDSPGLLMFVGSLLKATSTFMFNGGYGASYSTALGKDDADDQGEMEAAATDLLSFEFFLTVLLLAIAALIGAGYASTYLKAVDELKAGKAWPTKDMQSFDAFFNYWLDNIFKEIGEVFSAGATLADVYAKGGKD